MHVRCASRGVARPLNCGVRRMVEFYASIAKKWHQRRWFVAQLLALAVAVILMSDALSAPRVARIALLVAGPVGLTSSGILLACVGFHPVHGYLSSYRPT